MRNKHITRFGSPLTRSGALYFASDQEGLIQMDVDMELAKLHVNGVVITPVVKSLVLGNVLQKEAEYHNKVDQVGVPDKIKTLFQITRKAKAEQYSRKLVLSEYDLFLLIHNCTQIRLAHRSKFKIYVPDHLTVLDADRDELKVGNPKLFLTKVRSGLLERRYIHVHLFEYGSDWHCFYFSHDDIDPEDSNHWKYGCHLHYVSHLWPNLEKEQIWNCFDERSTEISGNLHIRFSPFVFPNPDEVAKNRQATGRKPPPWAVIFDPDLAPGKGSVPVPVAHMATRGLWVVKFSIPDKPSRKDG